MLIILFNLKSLNHHSPFLDWYSLISFYKHDIIERPIKLKNDFPSVQNISNGKERFILRNFHKALKLKFLQKWYAKLAQNQHLFICIMHHYSFCNRKNCWLNQFKKFSTHMIKEYAITTSRVVLIFLTSTKFRTICSLMIFRKNIYHWH